MITHVQTHIHAYSTRTGLRKAGNYDKTGRARKNTGAFHVYTGRIGPCRGGGARAKRTCVVFGFWVIILAFGLVG